MQPDQIIVKKRVSARIFLVVFGVFAIWALNTIAMKYSWYVIIPYFDKFMHFSGGVWVALAGYELIARYPKSKIAQLAKRYRFFIIAFVFAIGFGWEIFEIILGKVTAINFGSIADTIGDLCFDTAGAFVVYFLHAIRKIAQADILRGDGLGDGGKLPS